jgi:hypothetical protein
VKPVYCKRLLVLSPSLFIGLLGLLVLCGGMPELLAPSIALLELLAPCVGLPEVPVPLEVTLMRRFLTTGECLPPC